ncbi:GNAT family N-acetyltransferase [Nocardioides sp. HDW12B]|uniref:GNAT family N-acetyltransferase n=1 Tax=Nocardioides sp. HDW12B TaxID=2714939 RepID=UPI00140B6E92|nr:GNAT family N-acetyltransferase [Nocardioides sp. HDW12B]QIK66231.1 GNAT family N-acetyltransferase [Nocardioides sp. HDW12B]
MSAPLIRPGTEADLHRLVDVEVEAGQVFRTVGMTQVADDVPQVSDLREAAESQRLWVTQVGSEVAGYISAEVLDGNAHVAQVSVAPAFAGRALGRAMIKFLEDWGKTAGRPATTLTTFRDVPWNGPYYLRLGYRAMRDEDIGPELARTMAHEASLPGIDASLRCAMIKRS